MKLDQFLKWQNLVSSGGEAKILIKSGSVKVNGEIETRRGRKLNKGDKVMFLKNELIFEQLAYSAQHILLYFSWTNNFETIRNRW